MRHAQSILDIRVDGRRLIVLRGIHVVGFVRGLYLEHLEQRVGESEVGLSGVTWQIRRGWVEGCVYIFREIAVLLMLHRVKNWGFCYRLLTVILPDIPTLKLVAFWALAFSSFFAGEST